MEKYIDSFFTVTFSLFSFLFAEIFGDGCDLIGDLFGLVETLGERLALGLDFKGCFDEILFLLFFVIDEIGESGGLFGLSAVDGSEKEEGEEGVDT